jgi:hypothetical protein
MKILEQLSDLSYLNSLLNKYKIDELEYSFTPESKVKSEYALLFVVFLVNLLNKENLIFKNKKKLSNKIRQNFFKYTFKLDCLSKEYMQLLAFSLSALYLVEGENFSFEEKLIKKIISGKLDLKKYLKNFGCLAGKPMSGNYAMFYAVFLIYINDYLKIDKSEDLELWINLHENSMNRFGFWGNEKKLLYRHIQNGYHQYEIFNYLNLQNNKIKKITNSIENLMNKQGGFSPYPGSGACYDYDAIFFLTHRYCNDNLLLSKNKLKIIINNLEYNYIGTEGFSENRYLQPLNIDKIVEVLKFPFNNNSTDKLEKIVMCLRLLRKKNRVIKNHYSEEKSRIGGANLFATWFRALSLCKIDQFINNNNKWKFINFPGIGN